MKLSILRSLAVIGSVAATSVTSCHSHGSEFRCINTDGVEGLITPAPSATVSSYTSCHTHGSETHCMNGSEEVMFKPDDHSHSDHDHSHSGHDHAHTAHDHDHDHGSHQTTVVTGCHNHGTAYMCLDGQGREGQILPSPTEAPESFTGCHSHATATYCIDANDREVSFNVAETEEEGEKDCHFHAGVEHCVSKKAEKPTCERVDRDYNIRLRIGLLFAILATSLIGVLGPIYIKRLCHVSLDGALFIAMKQFGTGVVISTAFVHLLTHAFLMFSNPCLILKYEATCGAIAMAGLVLAFVVDFFSRKLIVLRTAVSAPKSSEGEDAKDMSSDSSTEAEVCKQDKISVLLLECGIIFHSVLVGITLVVAGDSSFITLFVVILFHQMFEGIALGSRLAELDGYSTLVKSGLGTGFAITTPIGMAIGIGVLNHFNGNDPSTIIALGTLDSLSAGVLLWVGLVQMLAHDWLSGPLLQAGILKTICATIGLVAGLALMSLLGKWA